MAIRLGGTDGNTNITIGGRWNSPAGTGDPLWGSPISGATAFSMTLAIKPSSLTIGAGVEPGQLFHQSGLSGYSSPFNLRFDIAAARLRIALIESSDQVRVRVQRARLGCLLLNEWNFLMVRWRATGNLVTLYNNTSDITDYLDTVLGTPISALSTGQSPMEIGAESGGDNTALAGDYFRAAIWNVYLPDADAIAFGGGTAPNALSVAPVKYVTLSTYRNVGSSSIGTHAAVDDLVAGQGPYGDATMIYDYTGSNPVLHWPQGVFGDFSAASDPPAGPYVLPPPPPTIKTFAPEALTLAETFAAPVQYQGVLPPPDEGLLPDIKIMPKRGFSLQALRGRLGKRSGRILPVANFSQYQAALLASQPGDNIRIVSSAFFTTTSHVALPQVEAQVINDTTTPRMPPPGFPRHIRPRAVSAIRAIVTPARIPAGRLKAAGEPSWVVIEPDTVDQLPDLMTPMRDVPLPDGTMFRGIHEDCAITPAHYPLMPIIRQGAGLLLDLGFNSAPTRASRFCWRGIHFQGPANSDSAFLMFGANGNYLQHTYTWGENRKISRLSDHLMWQQCAFEADPDDKGYTAACIMASCEISYYAMVNCLVDKFWGQGPGEGKLFQIGGASPGPYHWENNHLRLCGGFWLTGGGGSDAIGINVGDFQIRRNWQQTVRAWVSSELNQHRGTGWNVTVTGARVTRGSGDHMSGWQGVFYHPRRGHVMYEFATGKARRVIRIDDESTTSVYTGLDLESAWPGAPTGVIRVGFQFSTPAFETSPLLYNSGLYGSDWTTFSDVPRAITVAGSRHVTLTHPLPQEVADEINVKEFPVQFYTNDMFWQGDVGNEDPGLWATDGRGMNDGTVVTAPDIHDTSWGWRVGKTRAQCKRKRVVSVAPDRMSFELDPTQDPYWESITFPFSMVRFDGLWRSTNYHFKGGWENKKGVRFLVEGNVMDEIGARDYALSQQTVTSATSVNDWIGICSIDGDILTIHPGELCTFTHLSNVYIDVPTPAAFRGWQGYTGPDVGTDVELRRRWGAPLMWGVVQTGQYRNVGGIEMPYMDYEYGLPGRIIDYVIDPTHLKLLPKDPDLQMLGNISHTFAYVYFSSTPWNLIKDHVFRYNKGHALAFSWYGEAAYAGATRRGGQLNLHDNLVVLLGGSTRYQDIAGGEILQAPQSTSPETIPNKAFGPGGQAGYDEPRMGGKNGHWQAYHNTSVQGGMRTPGMPATTGPASSGLLRAGDTINQKVKYIGVRDNIVVGDQVQMVPVTPAFTNVEVADPTATSWDAATCDARRNIFGGRPDMAAATRRWAYQDNAGVDAIEQVGFANPTGVGTEMYDVENYRLQDILATGAVSISADGLTVTHAGGAWPSTISPGQFFKLPGQPLVQIAGMGGGLGAAWRAAPTGFHKFSKTAGRALPEGGGGAWALQTRIQALNDTQYSEIVIGSMIPTGGFGQVARFNAATRNGYGWIGALHSYYGAPYVMFLAFRVDAGVVTNIGAGFGSGQFLPVPGDTYRCGIEGPNVIVRRNGIAVTGCGLTEGGGPEHTGGEVGLVCENNQSIQYVSFKSGDSTGEKTSELFTGGEDIFTLKTAYPVANVTGQPFVITFIGSATDGGTPGADLDLVAACTAGVVRPWAKD